MVREMEARVRTINFKTELWLRRWQTEKAFQGLSPAVGDFESGLGCWKAEGQAASGVRREARDESFM